MPQVLNEMKRQTSASKAQAMQTYRQLLSRADDPQPDDAELLRETLTTLGLTADDFEADAKALAELPSIESRFVAQEKLASLMEEQRKALAERPTMESFNKALRAADAKINAVSAIRDNTARADREARDSAAKLRRDHPRVWPPAIEPVPEDADLTPGQRAALKAFNYACEHEREVLMQGNPAAQCDRAYRALHAEGAEGEGAELLGQWKNLVDPSRIGPDNQESYYRGEFTQDVNAAKWIVSRR